MPDSTNKSLFDVIEKLDKSVESLGKSVETNKPSAFEGVSDSLKNISKSLTESFKSPIEGLTNGIDDLKDSLSSPFKKVKSFFKSPVKLFGGVQKLFGKRNKGKDFKQTNDLLSISNTKLAEISNSLVEIWSSWDDKFTSIEKSLSLGRKDRATDKLQMKEDKKERIVREERMIESLQSLQEGDTAKIKDDRRSSGLGFFKEGGLMDTLVDMRIMFLGIGPFLSKKVLPLLSKTKKSIGKLGPFLSKKVLPLLSKTKALIGKLALPLTAAIGIITGVLTFIKNKDTLGSFEAFKLGFTEFVNAVVGWPVDILLWIGEKTARLFGMDFVADMFSEMNFRDGFTKILDALGSFGEFIGEGLYNIFSSLLNPGEYLGKFKDKLNETFDFGGILNKSQDFTKSLLRSILPRPDNNKAWYKSVGGITSKAIPESIYRFAGIDKKTGSDINSVAENVAVATTASIPKRQVNSRGVSRPSNTSIDMSRSEVIQAPNPTSGSYLQNKINENNAISNINREIRESVTSAAIQNVVVKGGDSNQINNTTINSDNHIDRTMGIVMPAGV